MSCLNDKLLQKIANRVPIECLANIRDRKDKLESRIYAKKVEDLIQQQARCLTACSLCLKLYTLKNEEDLECFQAKVFVDFHGQIIARHVAEKGFSLLAFVKHMQEEKEPLTSKQIYWKLWGATFALKCETCQRVVSGSDLLLCLSHPK